MPTLTSDAPIPELGIAEMDATHREFADLVRKLLQAGNGEFQALFNELYEHTKQHFDREDQLMADSGFSALSEHRGEHQRVLGELTQFKRRVDKGLLALGRGYVKEQLPSWFDLHLATMDAALAAHLKTKGMA